MGCLPGEAHSHLSCEMYSEPGAFTTETFHELIVLRPMSF